MLSEKLAITSYPPREVWQENLSALPLISKLRWDYSLQRYNTMKIGGNAACFIEVDSFDDLSRLLPWIEEQALPWVILGKGSNLLIPDSGWPGIVLRLGKEFKQWQVYPERQRVYAGAGLADVTIAQKCLRVGLSGLEFLIGVPGTLGGAIAMNAGAHQAEMADFLIKVRWMDMQGHIHTSEIAEIDFRYRYSSICGATNKVILDAELQLEISSPQKIKEKVETYQHFRTSKQPQKIPNCGSVFKNPQGDYAARLIESCGLKGKQIGSAQISKKHSNFIVNLGEASAQDVLDLIQLAQDSVYAKYSIILEPEVHLLTP